MDSDRLAVRHCTYCEYAENCTAESANGSEKLCLEKSTETNRVWVRTTETRRKIEIGETYGSTTVVSLDHKDSNGYIYWNCKRGDLDISVRGDNLLRINSKDPERKYRRGSSRNPDGTLHKYPGEHSSKYGCALEKAKKCTIVNDEGEKVSFRYEDRVKCECGGTMRYDEYGDGLCEVCTGLSRRNKKPCLDPEVKAINPYQGMGVLEVRRIASDSSTRIVENKKTAKELTEEGDQLVLDYKAWCSSF